MGKEEIQPILEEYYPNIKEFLGDIIEKRLESPGYEDFPLVSRLLKASRKLPTLEQYEQTRDEDFYEEYDDFGYEYGVQRRRGFELDSGLYALDRTLFHGGRHCENFNCLFRNINLSKPQEIDNRMVEIFVYVKAFEFLSKLYFNDISAADGKQGEPQVYFVGNMHRELYAIVATRLYSVDRVEEHQPRYDERYVIRLLKDDIAHAVTQKYPQLKKVFRTRFGIGKGIIFIYSGRGYFGYTKYIKSLFGLQPSKIRAVLNSEWIARKSKGKSYACLHHIAITQGRQTDSVIVYPTPDWEQIS